jgi:hypothetical protein
MQHLLCKAVWDTEGVRDDLCCYVVEHIGDQDAVLVVDETGDLKKGTACPALLAEVRYTATCTFSIRPAVPVYCRVRR